VAIRLALDAQAFRLVLDGCVREPAEARQAAWRAFEDALDTSASP
jgi:hypothetical protein